MGQQEVDLDTPMMRQYNRIKQEHRDAILFFRLGDFYEMFKGDAEEVSRLLGLTLTQRNGVPMCGIPYHASRSYIARLIRFGRKIAICEQIHVPQGGKTLADRQVTEIITPGTVTEEDFLDAGINNYILALGATRDWVSESYLDLSTGEFVVHAFERENAGETFRRELARLKPKEILIQESLFEEDERIAGEIEQREELIVNRFPDWSFDVQTSSEKLRSLFGVANLRGFGIEDDSVRILTTNVLLEYVEENAKSLLPHIQTLTPYQEERYVTLDEATQRNLEIVANMTDGSRRYSLLSVIDQTRTPMGARLLRKWLLAPLRDVDEISHRHDRVEELYHSQMLLNSLRDELKSVLDLERLGARVGLEKAHAKDLVAVGKSLRAALRVQELLPQWSNEIASLRGEAEELVELLDRALVDSPSVVLHEGNMIREGYSGKLDELKELKANSRSVLDQYLEQERQESGIQSLKVRYNKIIGHFFEVTKSNLNRVPQHFIRRQSLVNSERFTTPRLSELEEKLNNASEEIVELERELFLELRKTVREKLQTLSSTARFVAEADCLQSFAWAATRNGYGRPRIRDDRSFEVSEGRHPVVEAHLRPGDFVPNSLAMSPKERRFALITGPNMAGKSTFLRQNALITLLAQAGSFVPAAETTIGVVDRIFCRVGASDNLARGESTFLVEMNETANILRNASRRSLIIMDEVGRGTSTNDGLAIAWAVSEHILRYSQSRTLFATHFHELTALEEEGLFNLSMRVATEGNQIVFLKRVQEGPANHSYGIHVAKLAGLPPEVLHRAEEILSGLESYAPEQADGAGTGNGAASRDDSAAGNGGEAAGGGGGRGGRGSGQAGGQADLFTPSEMILQEIAGLDVNRTNPLEALNAIARWKERLSRR
jgi:DNA mismatch repair protein MutS